MRIALIGPVYPYRGGIAHYTTLLAQVLRQAGHDVLLVSFRRQYPARLYPGESDRDPSAQPLATPDAHYWLDPLNPLTWRTTAAHVRRYAPDLTIFQWWSPIWAPAWWALGRLVRRSGAARLAFICHNVLPHEASVWHPWAARRALGAADFLLVGSQRERERLLDLLPGKRVAVAPHPVYDMLADADLSRSAARARQGITQDAPVLLHFGLVRPYKGLMTLVEALPAVRSALPGVRLLIAGEFWEDRGVYDDRIRALGLAENVMIDGRYIPNEEVAPYFVAADAVVLPYLHATQSGVAQLAFGFGAPVIATWVGGLPEVVRDGETGLLVAPGDPVALADAIVRFFREGMGDAMRAKIRSGREASTWAQLVETIETLAGEAE